MKFIRLLFFKIGYLYKNVYLLENKINFKYINSGYVFFLLDILQKLIYFCNYKGGLSRLQKIYAILRRKKTFQLYMFYIKTADVK